MPFHSRLLFLAILALPAFAANDSIAPGSLTTPAGLYPLRHTDVQVRIAGPLARVTVTQEFHNPFAEKIDEGHPRRARPQRCAGAHPHGLLHDRWRVGQRSELSKAHIRKLAEFFHVSPAVFLA